MSFVRYRITDGWTKKVKNRRTESDLLSFFFMIILIPGINAITP